MARQDEVIHPMLIEHNVPVPMRDGAWFKHDDPADRPPERFDGTNTLYTGGERESYLLMPMVL